MQAVRAMDDREHRQSKLLELLENKFLANQSEIVDEMAKIGFEVTQSSISRDFQDLGVVKVAGRYVPARHLTATRRSAIASDLIRKIEAVGPNMVVVKTDTGGAPIVATAIDRANLDGVVGTVAGDDTLFIATQNKSKQVRIISSIMQLL